MDSILDRIDTALPGLPAKLGMAARFALNRPDRVALASMRAVAAEVGVAAPTLMRLAQHLGFDGYDGLRAAFQDELLRTGFGARAAALSAPDGDDLAARMAAAAQANLAQALAGADPATLQAMARAMIAARHLEVVSTGAVLALGEGLVASGAMLLPGLRVARGAGATGAEAVATIGPGDAVLVLTLAPYARRTLDAAQAARTAGARVLAITDGRGAPITALADLVLFAPTQSPHYYPSMVALQGVIEVLLATVAALSDAAALNRIRHFDKLRAETGAYISG
jgi:DNA-binding MurR/RpiR family transcriptional regulator